jgi:hypothetical protein
VSQYQTKIGALLWSILGAKAIFAGITAGWPAVNHACVSRAEMDDRWQACGRLKQGLAVACHQLAWRR